MSSEIQKVGPADIQAGQTATEGFGTRALAQSAETASAAVAAQAQAAIQARYVMALKNPRDLDDVRVRLLKECKRPSFAKVARYHKPVGKGVEGPSIRFAEAAIRCMTNIAPETAVVYDTSEKRIVRVSVTDLESNVTYSQDIAIEKTVERSKVPDGQQPISSRMNSYGKVTYLLPAGEDDLLNKQNALISKAIRVLALRLVPGDIIDEAMTEVIRTQDAEDKRDPDAARRALVDSFASIGVRASELKEYLGHELDALLPGEGAHLRAVYAAIRDGEASWREVAEARAKERGGSATGDKQVTDLKERIKKKGAEIAKKKDAAAGATGAAGAPQPPLADAAPAQQQVVTEDGEIVDAGTRSSS